MENQQDIICYCKNISKQKIEVAIKDGAKTLKDIQKMTGACTGNQCKELNPKGICCSFDIIKLLPELPKKHSSCCG